jgi:hypothetical protein
LQFKRNGVVVPVGGNDVAELVQQPDGQLLEAHRSQILARLERRVAARVVDDNEIIVPDWDSSQQVDTQVGIPRLRDDAVRYEVLVVVVHVHIHVVPKRVAAVSGLGRQRRVIRYGRHGIDGVYDRVGPRALIHGFLEPHHPSRRPANRLDVCIVVLLQVLLLQEKAFMLWVWAFMK